MRLADFVVTRPQFESAQAKSLAWLATAHAQAGAPERRMGRLLEHCACPPDKVATRGHAVDLDDLPRAESTDTRMRLFGELVDAYFAETYATSDPPDDLIHVTCTGYISPSGAQKIVAAKGWGARTRVTHAYHMGCYAALPAVRMAAGFSAIGAQRVDLVHTELCSLHLDPSNHSPEQLVVQSLFADGLIRYSMLPDGDPGLMLVAAYEAILPDTDRHMGWRIGDRGMQMTLSREVPDRIAGALRPFMLELFRRGGLTLADAKRSVFCVHPGGPKIIDRVRDVLELSDSQLHATRDVLHDYGNMSSATLPHIWMRVLADPAVPRGTLIPSLAFGPGLTVCGALFEKR